GTLDGENVLPVFVEFDIPGSANELEIVMGDGGDGTSCDHAVVGDAVYGGTRRRLTPRHRVVAQLTRPFLHASRLAFTHPRDARRVEFRAPMPDDLERVLEALRDR
ncbi:MAG: hypothetical protein QGG24_09185, partial [Vicinamibacterales bacterium]|nr:hypothetical protein [Vicinamibacterales bacterium]